MKSMMIKLADYEEELASINKELALLPEGRLSKKGSLYYQVTNEKKSGITKNKKIIRELCRKRYLQTRQKLLTNHISAISTALKKIKNTTDTEIIDSFPSTYKQLSDDYFYHPSIEKWLQEDYNKNLYRIEDLKFSSSNGIKLRSKSEVFIANQLESYQLPYRYDAAIKLGSRTIYPDFIIKNPYNGKIILWEHFGALHLADYERKMNEKMALYLKVGYVPFETIIYTFESDIRNLERLTYLIENIIF